MLKEKIINHYKEKYGYEAFGDYDPDGCTSVTIYPKDVVKEISEQDLYIAEFVSSGNYPDKRITWSVSVEGVLMVFNIDANLYQIDKSVYKSSGWIKEDNLIQQIDFLLIRNYLMHRLGLSSKVGISDDGYVYVIIPEMHLDEKALAIRDAILSIITNYYNKKYGQVLFSQNGETLKLVNPSVK